MVSILLLFLVCSKELVFGSKAGNWVYPYFDPTPTVSGWILLVALLSVSLSALIGGKLLAAHEKTTLFLYFLLLASIQSLVRKAYPFSLGQIVQSDAANSFYAPAMRFSAVDVLTRFEELAPSLPLHARGNMPGKILLYELFGLFTSSPEIMGYLVIVLSSLGALLLYGVCTKLFHDRRVAFYSLMLYALVPCKLFFLPILNTVTPVFMLLCLYLLLVYIESKHLFVACLLGVALYILILFEPSPLIAGIIMLGILFHATRERRFVKRDYWGLLAGSGLGFLVVYIFFSVFFSFDLLRSVLYVLNSAMEFNLADNRDYLIWVGANAKEFFYGVGLPIMFVLIYMTMNIFGQCRILKDTTGWSLENVFLFSLWFTFLVLLFLGINRGEVTRLWIYLAVLFQIPASIFMAKIPRGEVLISLVAATLVLQDVLTLHRVGFVIP